MGMIGDLFVRLRGDNKQYKQSLDEAKKKTSVFGNAIKKIGGIMAGVFAVSTLTNFGRELLKLSGQAVGVRQAFKQIGTESQLDVLRNSVKGTVSDLELMKRAVMADNFKIPINSLGKLFQFATKRAQQTGESVDYLVNSIVLGIGRKSPLILDNLGISAVRLRQELKGAGTEMRTVPEIAAAVGRIAAEEMSKAGDIIDTVGIKIDRLTTKWENFKLSLAESPGFQKAIGGEIDDLSNSAEILFSESLSWWEKFLGLLDLTGRNTAIYAQKSRDATKAQEEQNRANKDAVNSIGEVTVVFERHVSLLQAAKDAANEADQAIKDFKSQSGRYAGLDSAQAYIDKLEELQGAAKKARSFVSSLQRGKAPESIKTVSANGVTGGGELDTQTLGNLDSSISANQAKYKQFMEEYLQDWNDFSKELNRTISSGISGAITSLTSGLAELATGAITGEDFGKQVLSVIGGFMQQLGALMIAYAINMALFAESAKNPLAWPVALAAGVALVAAGAAISSLAKGGIGGGASASAASGYSSSNFSQSNAAATLSGNVVFELEGNKLRGALNNTDRRNTLIR